jgi:flagellar biosynthesis/type III secretory pathway M-ring protein FliF/YscJ
MTSGQAVVVGVGLALILVIVVAVAAFVWRQVLVRRRTPEEQYRRAVKDVQRVQADLKRGRLRDGQPDKGPDPSGVGGMF